MHCVARRDHDDLSYFLVGETFGKFWALCIVAVRGQLIWLTMSVERGGTQIWEQEIAAFAVQTLEKKRNAPLPPNALEHILRVFHQTIKQPKADKIEALSLFYTDDDGGHFLTVPAEKAKQCFWKAMRDPLERAAKEIARAASLKYDVRVVVYGGSGQNSIVQAKIKEACEKAGVNPPYFAQNGSRAKE